MRWTSSEELLDLHHIVAEIFRDAGDPIRFTGERSPGLADTAVHRPLAEFGGRQIYKTEREKVAALIHSINSSHVFHDGNKRTSVAALVVLLDRNDWRLDAADRDLTDLMVRVATPAPPYNGATEETVRQITAWIRARTSRKSLARGDIDVLEFLDRCERVGGNWRTSGPSYVLTGTKGSVRVSRSTTSLSEGAARSFLSTVGLSEAYTGVSTDEFIDGRPKTIALVCQYREALEMLAAHDRSDD